MLMLFHDEAKPVDGLGLRAQRRQKYPTTSDRSRDVPTLTLWCCLLCYMTRRRKRERYYITLRTLHYITLHYITLPYVPYVQKAPFAPWRACSCIDEQLDVLRPPLARGHVKSGQAATVAGVDDVAALGASTETISTVTVRGKPLP